MVDSEACKQKLLPSKRITFGIALAIAIRSSRPVAAEGGCRHARPACEGLGAFLPKLRSPAGSQRRGFFLFQGGARLPLVQTVSMLLRQMGQCCLCLSKYAINVAHEEDAQIAAMRRPVVADGVAHFRSQVYQVHRLTPAHHAQDDPLVGPRWRNRSPPAPLRSMPHEPPVSLACTLRDDIFKVTGGQPMRWIMVGELGLRHPDATIPTLDAAVALAIEKWMTGGGKPAHSVCLTDEGRRLAQRRTGQPPLPIPHQASMEHHPRCPICGHMVDELDLGEVLAHLESEHEPPVRN